MIPKNRAHALFGAKLTPLRQRFRKAPFSPVHTTTGKRRFQKDPLWRAFSKSFVFGDRKRRLRVDANPKRIKKDAFSKRSGYVWTGQYSFQRRKTENQSLQVLWNVPMTQIMDRPFPKNLRFPVHCQFSIFLYPYKTLLQSCILLYFK